MPGHRGHAHRYALYRSVQHAHLQGFDWSTVSRHEYFYGLEFGWDWMRSKDDRDQYGIEAYWRISLSQNTWLTPGIHLVFDPSLNPHHDFIAIPHLKFRIAL